MALHDICTCCQEWPCPASVQISGESHQGAYTPPWCGYLPFSGGLDPENPVKYKIKTIEFSRYSENVVYTEYDETFVDEEGTWRFWGSCHSVSTSEDNSLQVYERAIGDGAYPTGCKDEAKVSELKCASPTYNHYKQDVFQNDSLNGDEYNWEGHIEFIQESEQDTCAGEENLITCYTVSNGDRDDGSCNFRGCDVPQTECVYEPAPEPDSSLERYTYWQMQNCHSSEHPGTYSLYREYLKETLSGEVARPSLDLAIDGAGHYLNESGKGSSITAEYFWDNGPDAGSPTALKRKTSLSMKVPKTPSCYIKVSYQVVFQPFEEDTPEVVERSSAVEHYFVGGDCWPESPSETHEIKDFERLEVPVTRGIRFLRVTGIACTPNP